MSELRPLYCTLDYNQNYILNQNPMSTGVPEAIDAGNGRRRRRHPNQTEDVVKRRRTTEKVLPSIPEWSRHKLRLFRNNDNQKLKPIIEISTVEYRNDWDNDEAIGLSDGDTDNIVVAMDADEPMEDEDDVTDSSGVSSSSE